MIRKVLFVALVTVMMLGVTGCSSKSNDKVKVGVSMGVGGATRWEKEKTFMEERAKELNVDIEVRLNKTDTPLTQEEDCKEMINSGIDVLILTPRDVNNVSAIIDYAREKKVKVVSYARVVLGDDVDLYVGYDSNKIGQIMGQYLSELVYQGDYIILSGDENDYNAQLINDGAMKYIDPIREDINVILETSIPAWDAVVAKEKVKEAVTKNGNKVDAIFAPNDKIAGACSEVIKELNITTPVVITGMDAELDAIKRIAQESQGCTIYMDLKELASTALEEAVHLVTDEKVDINAQFDNGGKQTVNANLIVGTLITSKNITTKLIDTKIYTKEEVYGPQ